MFKALQKVFGTPSRASHPMITGHHVKDREQVVSLLIQIHQAHVLLNVTVGDHKAQYSSALLGIYEEHGFIVLDELTPEEGHHRLLEQHDLKVAGRLEGVEFRFATRLQEAREKSSIAFYKVDLPEEIYYRQRRKDFRIPSRGLATRFHGLRGKGQRQILKGYVNDLSRKGIGLILEDDVSLSQGEVLPSCIIKIPGEKEIAFSLEVRFSRYNQQQQVTRVGGRFRDIDRESLRRICSTINKLERAQARRLHGV